jgi:sugar phosphate isomerase/epimerase
MGQESVLGYCVWRCCKPCFDNFSVRAWRWKADRLLEYASELAVDILLFSDLAVYESHDASYLTDLKRKANDLGVEIQVGTGSICPSSNSFKDNYGSAEEHLRLLIRVAQLLGSKVARCYMGTMRDRKGPGGIQAHIDNTLAVLKKVRSYALDTGVMIAVENHAGDTQAHELVRLIEEAGTEFVGATLDSGNATWTLESPMRNLEILGPYAVTTGIRDSMIWETEAGAISQWITMGRGLVDWPAYVRRFSELRPDGAIVLEVISELRRELQYLKKDFWEGYEAIPAHVFSEFLSMAKRGSPVAPISFPKGKGRDTAVKEYQKAELERNIRYCKDVLGLGLKS